jgi:two-component system NtrC family sensor kinase
MLTIGVSLCGLITILGLIYFSIINLNKNILSEEINSLQDLFANAYIEPMWSFDNTQINEISKTFLKHNGFSSISALEVSDTDGKIIFYQSSDNNKNIKTIEGFANMPFTQIQIIEIKKNNERLGTLSVAFTNVGVANKLQNIFLIIFCSTLVVLAIASSWIYLSFNKLIRLPINSLLEQIKLIREENYDTYEISSSSIEFKLISNALNYTSQLVNRRNLDLKIQADNLEKIVEERTLELENQTLKNINSSRLAAVGELASGIAHEINNPLAVISGQVMKIKRNINTKEDSVVSASLEKINQMISRIVKIINGLKIVSRDGKSDPLIDFSVVKMIDEINAVIEDKIKSANITLLITIDPTITNAYGREVQISQVLVNLINNSVDAISTSDERWIKLAVIDSGDYLRFEITDSGRGIPHDILNKIMLPFFTTKEIGKGTGLGLSISSGIIKAHGGIFEYNSDCPNTQFAFTIYKNNSYQKAASE